MAYALVLETQTVLVTGTSAAMAEILQRVVEVGLEEGLLVDPGSGKANTTDAEYTVRGVFEDHALSLRCGSTDFKTLDYQRTNPAAATAAAKSLQLYPTLCDPIDGSPPGSPVPGILQARTLEWVAISFSNA